MSSLSFQESDIASDHILAKAMSNEWAKHNIQVNCICPGYIKTAMTKVYTEDEAYNNYSEYISARPHPLTPQPPSTLRSPRATL